MGFFRGFLWIVGSIGLSYATTHSEDWSAPMFVYGILCALSLVVGVAEVGFAYDKRSEKS